MKSIIFLLLILGLISSCDKFEHSENKYIKYCNYCNLADNIEGSYTGRYLDIEFLYFDLGIQTDTVLDTIITVSVTRSFENLNHLEDSIVFKFNTSRFFDEISFSESSIQNGTFHPTKYSTQKFTNDNILQLVETKYITLTSGPEYYNTMEFSGEKD